MPTESGSTVTFLLRNTACFDKDEVVQKHLAAGRARLVKGDATVTADVAKAWAEAGRGDREGEVDIVLFTVGEFSFLSFPSLQAHATEGGTPTITMKGGINSDPTLCTRGVLALLSTVPPALRAPGKQPRIIIISSTGVTQASHEALPLAWRLTYPWLLKGPHADKTGLERVLAHVAGRTWTEPEPPAEVMIRADWQNTEGLPAAGELKDTTVVVRPSFLTDGKLKAQYKLSREGEGYYSISRRDVAHFITEDLLKNGWTKWRGDIVSIGY